MTRLLEGKRIIVTGAAQGIGAVLAAGFSKMGAKIALVDIADPEPAAQKIRDQGGEAIGITTDVTDLAACEAMVATISPFSLQTSISLAKRHQATSCDQGPTRRSTRRE